ncbi:MULTISPECIES: lasso peptide biosynthesis B2 protein [Gracilibacillus]|uniref:lasso peptide biosynthesis B2 protein n=1 Tax=Gracilibacillus TaxID=74385 RepID=UPI0008244D7E|nr:MULTISPECIES: lasso peptide biosynthesis B2 protein [Gracilibacillus]
MRKVKILLALNIRMKCLLMEAFVFLALARLLKTFSFAKIAPSLGERMKETSTDIDNGYKKTLMEISQAIDMISKYTFWESECLVRGIAALKMLERRKIESTLYLGTAKDEAGKLMAHAWLRSGPFCITGAEGMERFTMVSTFAKTIEMKDKR